MRICQFGEAVESLKTRRINFEQLRLLSANKLDKPKKTA